MKLRIVILYWTARLLGLPLAFTGRFHDSNTTRRGSGRVAFTTDVIGEAVEAWAKQKARNHGEGAHHLTLEIFLEGALAQGRKPQVPKAVPGAPKSRPQDAGADSGAAPDRRGSKGHRAHDPRRAAGLAGQPAGERIGAVQGSPEGVHHHPV